jgi:hypothetical protein
MMDRPPVKPDEYRRKADECRDRAATASRPDDKAAWLRMAEQWQLLAQDTESRADRSLPPLSDGHPTIIHFERRTSA